ncbi:SusC/RagA family TonB-linked outer membrane protein [Sphingobacterium corticibacter]|uniref:SusC/RagA family TonB-linked outer membrane protein n=1 Tax=Sphingobacterium corticibacter TaxID=2171749 RepID=A0A2T8HL69_9SPHI|nr:SusC/RagA family TonB-linked outer membrane protein [Sphingobacterium corticibacter]PVH26189.1 SusC/RagA family TonB-linked outer membrane protein [Sphingobacterium corticibacter]
MERKLFSFILAWLLLMGIAHAQTRTISGNVVSSRTGQPLAGATVRATGTDIAVQTNAQGKFTIDLSGNTSTLTVNFVGMQQQIFPLGSDNTINIQLDDEDQSVGEVIVTALGVQRTRNSLGYSVQAIKGEDLSMVRQPDLNTALAGKIAGVQVQSTSGAAFGTSTIRIRGINSLSGGNPIYVVDGMITEPEAVNMDDVADLTVLKGPAATALYGQRGSEGAVVIKTLGGRTRDGVGVNFNQATSFESVYLLPKYQNEYAGGYSQEWSTYNHNPNIAPDYLAPYDGVNILNYGADESWGPRMDGTMYMPFYGWDPSHPQFGQLTALVPQPNNVRDFYNTGVSANTNIAFDKAGDNYQTRFSFTNVSRTGIVPNSKLGRNWLSTNSSLNLTDKLTVSANVNFQHEVYNNRPKDGYSSQTTGSFNQWFQRQLDMSTLRDYKRPDGTFRSWNIVSPTNPNPAYWDNPYTEVYENTQFDTYQRIYGNITASYQLTNALSASVIARGNFLNMEETERIASGTLQQASYSQYLNNQDEVNYVGTLAFKEQYGDFTVDAAAFGEYRRNQRRFTDAATAGGLAVPGLYTLEASIDRPTVQTRYFDQRVNSLYGYAAVGYKDFLYLEGNIRNDWSSTLPRDNNSFLYGGLSTSFIFSHFIQPNEFFSFGKLRASFAKVGTDTDPYQILQTYSIRNAYGSNPLLTVPDVIPNANLLPTLSTSYEIGTELRFFNSRLLFDFNYYTRSATNQILNLPISGTTGFAQSLINAGRIDNHGYEFTLGGTPIRNSNFKWDLNANIGINRNKVVRLDEQVSNLQIELDDTPSSFGFVGSPLITLNAYEGQPYGQLIGMGIVKDDNGNRVVGEDGYYLREDNMNLGSIIPDFTGGLTSSFSYKNFRAGFSLDFQKGGKYMSISSMFGNYTGVLAETAGLNENGVPRRDPVENMGGTLLPGVKENGEVNDIFVDTQNLYENDMFSLWEEWVYDRSFIKLREVNIGYDLPTRLFQNTPFKSASFSLIATNPWLIYAKNRNVDPSILETSWFEGGQLPSTRSWGFSLRLGL